MMLRLQRGKFGFHRICRHFSSLLHKKSKVANLVVKSSSSTKSDVDVVFTRSDDVSSECSDFLGYDIPKSQISKFKGKLKETMVLHNSDEEIRVYVGIDSEEKSAEDAGRTAAFQAIQHLEKLNVREADLHIPESHQSDVPFVRAITQSAVLSTYKFDRYKSSSNDDDSIALETLNLILPENNDDNNTVESVVKEQIALNEGTILARDLGNERGDVAHPDALEETCRDLCSEYNFRFKVLKGADTIERERLHLLHAVGQGAQYDPRLVIMEYIGNPSEANKIDVALVGKGITFDTGGLNLKPTGFIEDMHLDKGGAVAVIGAMRSIGELVPQGINVVACCALAENAISREAFKPHAILKSRDGKSVEVGNTDAEGRLVLADAMTYIQDSYSPSTMVDMATLTGACVVALGEYTAGVFSNDENLSTELVNLGTRSFERCWPLPLLPEYTEELKSGSEFADLRSIGSGREAGACTAAAFLGEFVSKEKNVSWAHVDIAGSAMYSKPREFMSKGATGFGASLLAQLCLSRGG